MRRIGIWNFQNIIRFYGREKLNSMRESVADLSSEAKVMKN